MTEVLAPETEVSLHRTARARLYHGETRVDFMGRKWWGIGVSAALIIATIVSLFAQGLNLGLDFNGGVQWEVPSANITDAQARDVLNANGVTAAEAKIVTVSASGVERLRIQTSEQPADVRQKVSAALAKAGKVDIKDISSNSVTASWGKEITNKAVRALVVFIILVALFIAWRFEWAMALSAIAAMLHDVLISVGIYSILQLEVTPATVIAFLTILGFSLYDTIVVFDKVDENTVRFAGSRLPYDDVINVSMNQVVMRSLNTSLAAVLPVLSLLVVGAGLLGAISLREFALALFVGLVTGSYSSIFIAAPLLAWVKGQTPKYKAMRGPRAVGVDLERLVMGGSPAARREAQRLRSARAGDAAAVGGASVNAPEALLTHAPRPRKKKRR
ncbi:MAG: protein translocase subunit SecF [Actinobacteria bacterium]|nr:protein translocase subunit SecF [Actinomycetota bacterium]